LLDESHLGVNALDLLLHGESLISNPLGTLVVLVDRISGLGLDTFADWLGFGLLGTERGGSDGSMYLLVDVLEFLALEYLVPLGELLLEFLGVLSLEEIIIVLDVFTENVLAMFFGVKDSLGLLSFHGLSTFVGDNLGLDHVMSGESLILVGNVETTICGTLHGTEDTVTGGSADETDIKESLEGTSVIRLNLVEFAIDFLVSNESLSKSLFGEKSSGAEKSSAVCSGVVSQTSLKSEFLELGRVSG